MYHSKVTAMTRYHCSFRYRFRKRVFLVQSSESSENPTCLPSRHAKWWFEYWKASVIQLWGTWEYQEGPILQASHLDHKRIHCLFVLGSALKEQHTCFGTAATDSHMWAGWHFHTQIISFPSPEPRESLLGNPHLSRAGGRGAGGESGTQGQGSRLWKVGNWSLRRNGKRGYSTSLFLTVNMYNLHCLVMSYSNIYNSQVIWVTVTKPGEFRCGQIPEWLGITLQAASILHMD